MDYAIYLNDRKYRICDIGEGKCTLVISYAEGVESLHEHYSRQSNESERIIVIDISSCWGGEIDSLDEKEHCELMGDIQLLADIYWLEDYKIKAGKK